MALWIDRGLDFNPSERPCLFSRISSRIIPGALALALSTLFGVWILYLRPAAAPVAIEAPAAAPAVAVASNPYGRLFDPRTSSGFPPVSLAQSMPLKSTFESIAPVSAGAIAEPESVVPTPERVIPQLAENAPLPIPRPAELGPPASHGPSPAGRRFAQQNGRIALPITPADNRTFFEKLFGTPPAGPVLAYAAPEDGVLGSTARSLTSSPSSRYDRWTAIYDVAAHTVYLPTGTRLEAHSGLGNRLDDPRYVSERMRGATPPNVYQLQPREQLFHGVQALRLIPVGGGDVFGRTGLLAHTYMLGPNGDSNGCVSFKNYAAFLQAYQNGEVKRLAVVTRLN